LGGVPVAFDGSGGPVQSRRDLFQGEAGEDVEFDDFDGTLGFGGEAVEGLVQRQEKVRVLHGEALGFFQFYPVEGVGTLGGYAAAGVIDEYAPHLGGGYGVEMVAGVEVDLRAAHEENERFVDQRCGLQGVVPALLSQVRSGDAAEGIVNLREEQFFRLPISVCTALQQASYVARLTHGSVHYDSESGGVSGAKRASCPVKTQGDRDVVPLCLFFED
jgi:hypothetical protein